MAGKDNGSPREALPAEAQPSTLPEPAPTETSLGELSGSRILDVLDFPVGAAAGDEEQVSRLRRLNRRRRAVAFRLLPKDQAARVFEQLGPALQAELLDGLQDEQVAAFFDGLAPDDRVTLIDEVPATVARQLMRGLTEEQRALTSVVLGYPRGSIGRRMSPEFITTTPELTVRQTLERLHSRLEDAETVYILPVTDAGKRLVGLVSLRRLLSAEPDTRVDAIMGDAYCQSATTPEEDAARLCTGRKLLALPIVDSERRVVGILTVDDALRILEEAETEDQSRISGSEPLRRPYLATPIFRIVKSRLVWLLVLAVGATLTVSVLEVFEATIAQMVVLSLFVPLLIGTGGNTGNQAATTVTRALALKEVTPRDLLKVLGKEVRVGATLGLLIGGLGFVVAAAFYGPAIGLVMGASLLAICTMAAAVGGLMPMLARFLKVDPAVFSNPFISTFIDAAGLLVYFMIARTVLGI
ncbi:magnesium transporter [Arthrobacter sulfonylureivorans]|uniref:magnesium transporter n=1 Tax=Arthrobacter sulfonylureivorans TaxID=2486855 RepID=UPI0039E47488